MISRRHQADLLPRLWNLWATYTAEPAPPYLDRWLAQALGRLDGLRRPDRLWLGEQLTAGVRHARLALACHTAAGLAPGRALRHVLAGAMDWPRLREIPPQAFFFWIFLRGREDGAEPPRLDEPHPGAVADWHRLRAGLEKDASLAAHLAWAGLPTSLAVALADRARRSAWTADDLQRFVARHDTRPPLWLRLRDAKDRREVLAELRGAGFKIDVHDLAVAARGDRGIYELACHAEGRVEIQDLASQAIGRAVAAGPGMFVWDACAGGGGKTLQIAAMMGNTGAVYATDKQPQALQDLRRRAKRAGFTSVRAHAWDGTALPDFGKTVARRGGFDRVLVDAPCSGCGTWRRNPDGRLRGDLGDPGGLAGLTDVQARLLNVAGTAVKPGGRLVYATCSWLAAENEQVVEAYLAATPAFTLVEQGLHGNPAADADTVYCAVLARTT